MVGWRDGGVDGGVSRADWDITDFEREMTSELEGPQPTLVGGKGG